MFVHVFLFRWKAAAKPADHERAQKEIEHFACSIPGLRFVAAGTNVSANDCGFGFGGVMHFDDEAVYRAYAEHPAHQRLLQWLAPLIDAAECDFTVANTPMPF